MYDEGFNESMIINSMNTWSDLEENNKSNLLLQLYLIIAYKM